MPAATITTTPSSVLPVTQASLTADIQSALTSLFGNPVDSFTSGSDNFLVFQKTFDTTKQKGSIFLKVCIHANLSIYQTLSDGWDSTAHTGNNEGSANSTQIFNTNRPITYTTVNHPEMSGVVLSNGDNVIFPSGYFRPSIKPYWLSEDIYSYCFQFVDGSFKSFQTTNANNWAFASRTGGNQDYNYGDIGRLAYPNPGAKRDVVPGIVLYSPESYGVGYGVAGVTSTDIAQVAGIGLAYLDILQIVPGQNEYLVLGASAHGMAIKVV